MALLPKPQKPPTTLRNLRPISLLPAEAKIIARIAAQRLSPYLDQALQSSPQFAYAQGRQTYDALDKVNAHCSRIRQQVADSRQQPFVHRSRPRSLIRGGMQTSLDLSKAFDRLPWDRPEQSLRHVQAPEDLISLVLYLHDEMMLVFVKDDYTSEIRPGAGIRQGCGLAPLLWASLTILVFTKLEQYLLPEQITMYADDYHIAWEVQSIACSSRMLAVKQP